MVKVTYKEEFSYDDPRTINFNNREDFFRWFIKRYKNIKLIKLEENVI